MSGNDNNMPDVLIVSVEDEVHIVFEPDGEEPYRNFDGGQASYTRNELVKELMEAVLKIDPQAYIGDRLLLSIAHKRATKLKEVTG